MKDAIILAARRIFSAVHCPACIIASYELEKGQLDAVARPLLLLRERKSAACSPYSQPRLTPPEARGKEKEASWVHMDGVLERHQRKSMI